MDFERGFYSGFTSAQHTDHNITSVSSFLQWGFYSFTVCCRITYAGYYTVVRFSACWDEQPLQERTHKSLNNSRINAPLHKSDFMCFPAAADEEDHKYQQQLSG